tara:strand:+ start:175 stop:570 length:396 start_codon:yes stop_codon:yes gene_type:complete
MRLEDLNSVNEYELYKKTDELSNEFFEESDLDKIFNEYNKLENENIVVKKKATKILNNFSKQLDKINKYPSLNFDEFSSLDTYFFTQIYLIILSISYLFLLLYFNSIFVMAIFPVGLFIGDRIGIIEKVNY